MLQQTQISRVLPKYKEFLKEFPNIKTLARTSDKKLLKVWAGLGYWRRAKFLKEAAKRIVREYKGKFPQDPKILETFHGIGHYTARALTCFAFSAPKGRDLASGGGNQEAFLDTNIRRVYLHFFFPNKKDVSDTQILKIAQRTLYYLFDGRQKHTIKISAREWHYALFDYGATVLKDKTINKRSRHYHRQSKFEGSFRSFRTRAVRFILEHPHDKVTHQTLTAFLQKELKQTNSPYSPDQIISALLKDNLIKKSLPYYFL